MLRLCGRFHCLPSALYGEDSELLRLVRIAELGNPPEDTPEGGE